MMKETGMNKNVKKENRHKKINSNRLILIFVCAFLAAVLLFGAVLGIILAVRSSRAVVKYENVTMDAEVLSFFEVYYKYQYMTLLSKSGIKDVADTEEFWSKADESGKTYGELLKEGAREYISSVTVANYLFNSYTGLTDADKDKISDAAEQTLEYKADGSERLFNEKASVYGFDYDSFKLATKMLYKASVVKNIIYGSDGKKLQSYPEEAAEYLAEYTHVKLLFIRTEDTFVLDENGNRITTNEGTDLTRPLTDEEKEARAALISEIRGYISAIGVGNIEMSEEMFKNYLDKNDEGDRNMHGDGYYFHKNSEFTAEFSEVFASIVEKSYSMKLDSFDEIELDFGICFIYKYAPTAGAYKMSANEMCFTDFYPNARDALFEKSLLRLSPAVIFTDKYNSDAIIARPYNYELLPVF